MLQSSSRGGGSACQVRGGVPGLGGCLPGGGWGVLPARSQGGCLPGPGGGSPCQVREGGFSLTGDPPPVNRITHMCKNITLATTSLRPVKIISLMARR